MNKQHAILVSLKEQGPQTAQQLAVQFNITSVGTRKHLLNLREQGLVEDESRAEKAGRPAQYWRLTAEGHREFPDRHGELTVQIIDSIQNLFGEQGMAQLIERREQLSRKSYSQALRGAISLHEKIAILTELRKNEGYMAVWEEDDEDSAVLWLHENHCPICDAASRCLNFCRSELNLFQEMLGSDVHIERVNHILTGARRCSYRISKKV